MSSPQPGADANDYNNALTRASLAVTTAANPLEALRANVQLIAIAMDARTEAVADARLDGSSWAEIGAALGVSKAAAHKRYGLPPEPATPSDNPTPQPAKTSHFEYYDLAGNLQGHLVKAQGPAPAPMPPGHEVAQPAQGARRWRRLRHVRERIGRVMHRSARPPGVNLG